MSNTANAPENLSRVEITHYEQHRLHAHYSGAIDRSGALALTRILELAFGYYRYPALELAIESPGGALDALVPMASAIRRWQAQGHAVEVRSTFECASAAALLLVGGTWGRRSVSPGTSLVFHFPRVVLSRAVIKSSAAQHISRSLRRCDEQSLDWLQATATRAAGGAEALAGHVAQRSAELHRRCDEVDLAMVHPLTGRVVGPMTGARLLRPLQRLLAAQDFESAYRKSLAQMMSQDAPIDLRLAYALCLVDRVDGVLDAAHDSASEAPAARRSLRQEGRASQAGPERAPQDMDGSATLRTPARASPAAVG